MNNRPKPGEDEDDLLKLQKEFLASGSFNKQSASIKRPDKRKTNNDFTSARDVVRMEGIEMSNPFRAESNVPVKKSKFRSELVNSSPSSGISSSKEINLDTSADMEEDVEELMNRKDTGLAAVLTTIIERDTRNETFVAPNLGKQPFPTVSQIGHMEQTKTQSQALPGKTKKKSLFAQQVEAQGIKSFGVEPVSAKGLKSKFGSDRLRMSALPSSVLSVPCVIDGGGLSASNSDSESKTIHQENMEKLSTMSEQEILEEQQKLLKMIDPKLVEFLKEKRKAKEIQTKADDVSTSSKVTFSSQREIKKKEKKTPAEGENKIPITISKNWVNMGTVERDKLEWINELPPPSSTASLDGRPARFDFEGNLLAVDADVPVNVGLHHHGEEPERAGYSLEELFQLSRSSNLQQRVLALHTLARIISQAKTGYLSDKLETPIIPAILAGGVVMLLRWSLDESVERVVAAALDALHALICSPLDEEAIDQTWGWYQGNMLPALTPTATREKENQPEDVDEENMEVETDSDVVKRDVVQALVSRMELMSRLHYILSSMKHQPVTIIHMLEILTRVAQHSATMAYEIIKCKGLMDRIVKEFLPTAWFLEETNEPISNVYGLPMPAAMRLIRVLCQSGRNAAAVLVSQFQLNMIILRYLAVEISDLQMPHTEAVKLHMESLAVWRVCATYGLVSQLYFDLYANIISSIGKLESRWFSSLTISSSTLPVDSGSKSDSSTGRDNQLDVGLVCVLEKILYGAGSRTPQHSFEGSNTHKASEMISPILDWSHVTSLYQPMRSCVTQMFAEIGSNYTVKNLNLALPTTCSNFMASYYDTEGGQSGIDEISSLEDIEAFSNNCLLPFFSSYGLSVIIEKLCEHSNILAVEAILPTETAPCLPTLSVSKMEVPSAISPTWKINMPVLGSHSPFGFLNSFLRLVLSICRRHKAMIPKLITPLVNNKDIQMYLKKVCHVSESPFTAAHFTRMENLFQYFFLKCCNLMPCVEMSLAHKLSLHLLFRIQHGDEHLIHDLISTVVFSPNFISEGEATQMASQAMANMSLSETLYLKSATQEEINVSKSQLLQEAFSSLASIRGHFLMAFGGMEKAVQDSRNLFQGNPSGISSQLIKCAGESLMPRDWVYMPLIHVYNKATNTRSLSGYSMSPQSIAMVTSVLQWNYLLEIWRPFEMSKTSVTLRLSRIMCAFLAGTDLFLEKPVHQYLAGLLRVFSSQKMLDKLDFEETIPGITSFYDLFQEFLDHYMGVSFGDPVFGLYVLLPLQQKHSSMLRKAVWGERRTLHRSLRVPLSKLLIPIQNYLNPEESDTELLQLYLSALITKAVQSAWSPVMYLLAVHHTNRFLFISHSDGNEALRTHMWGQVLANQNQVSDIIRYKQANIALPQGTEFYDKLPQSRQTTLDFYMNHFNIR